MEIYLGILLFSFIFSAVAIVPFIDLLYRLKFTHLKDDPPVKDNEKKESDVQALPQHLFKIGTPIGGGILIIFIVSLLFFLLYPIFVKSGPVVTFLYPLKEEINVLFFSFISFGILGLYEDIIKTFGYKWKVNIPGKKTVIALLSTFIALLLYYNLDIAFIHLPFVGTLDIGWLYIPLVSSIIYFFTRSFDITDGMDGLASGMLLICLMAFWGISVTLLDFPLSVFIALWIGSLLAFMYFNVYPARIWLGNAGSLSFGATFAVVGLLLGKTDALFVIGSPFLLEGLMQLVQKTWQTLFHKKIFSVTPLHYLLLSHGWLEPKIVFRSWLTAFIVSFLGLWFATG